MVSIGTVISPLNGAGIAKVLNWTILLCSSYVSENESTVDVTQASKDAVAKDKNRSLGGDPIPFRTRNNQ
jgi:hypothetical protein